MPRGTSVAAIPVLALLKMTAFIDKPVERARDLADLARILEGYLEDYDERRFGSEIIELGIEFEATNA